MELTSLHRQETWTVVAVIATGVAVSIARRRVHARHLLSDADRAFLPPRGGFRSLTIAMVAAESAAAADDPWVGPKKEDALEDPVAVCHKLAMEPPELSTAAAHNIIQTIIHSVAVPDAPRLCFGAREHVRWRSCTWCRLATLGDGSRL